MPADTDDERLEQRWRDGLHALADPGDRDRVQERVTARVRGRHRRRVATLAVAAVVVLAGIAGGVAVSRSGSGNERVRAGAGSTARPDPNRFQLRAVLAQNPAPCRPGQVPSRPGAGSAACYSLGPVALDGHDVAAVSVSAQRNDGVGLDVTLTDAGMAKFNDLAARLFGRPSPTNQMAVVIDGSVASTPQVMTSHFDGDQVRISGNFTGPEALLLARAIGLVDSTTPEPPPPDAQPALAVWRSFPVGASPRPVVLLADTELLGTRGFPDNASKDAYTAGSFAAPSTLPSAPATVDGFPVISAAEALATLRAQASPGPPAASTLTITDVRLGTAAFPTDRGARTLPAWLFSFRGVRDPAAIAAVAAPARFVPAGLDRLANGTASAVNLVRPNDTARTSSGGRNVTVTFTGAHPGTGPCEAEYAGHVTESSTAVAISIARTQPPSTEVCTLVGYQREVTVHLDAPLGNRVLIDATNGQPLAVAG